MFYLYITGLAYAISTYFNVTDLNIQNVQNIWILISAVNQQY